KLWKEGDVFEKNSYPPSTDVRMATRLYVGKRLDFDNYNVLVLLESENKDVWQVEMEVLQDNPAWNILQDICRVDCDMLAKKDDTEEFQQELMS
ncbi:MAG: hypothetical protein OXT67_01660, partial [Zetaproteobacteria bacterium]|nr:hypothetical protein [Zetaproteobacteria bacterium]